MSHPLFFRGITYFYPIGNTSAVWLTEHLPPEQQANVLLLACGDPRHILYTIYTNETSYSVEPQKLDITCCDMEPAVLARNALLFTLLADEGAQDRLDRIWNIFYHFVLDQDSLSLLIDQCRKLVTFAKDLESWNAGPYARFLTVCDTSTLSQLHRTWSLYVATADYTPDRYKRFKKKFMDGMKEVNSMYGDGFVLSSSRSAGPLLPNAVKIVAEQFRKFWLTGITDDGLHSTERATSVNPTFAFSISGEKFAVHYGTDPVAGFHLAEIFATSSRDEAPTLLEQRLVQAARDQFSRWCTSVVNLLGVDLVSQNLVIRMFAGDALMLCQAFSHLNAYGNTTTPILSSAWKASGIEFEENQYGERASSRAPTTFNVVDTSNISDHIGLLNLLVVTIPILAKCPSATLYTEALHSYDDKASTLILERLCGDLQTMSLLLGVIPSAFLSRFTTRSNVHEILLQAFNPPGKQYYEKITWKVIDSENPMSFAPDQLGRLLFGIYLNMFPDENMARQLQNMSLSTTRALLEPSLVHYTRRSFVQLLALVKSRVQTDWTLVMEKFDDGVVRDTSLILGSNFYQEMCCHFHLLNIVTFTSMEQSYVQDLRIKANSAIFRDWKSVPAAVTVVLVIPLDKITAVESELRRAGTPLLQCEIRTASFWNIFGHISAAYGRLETTGTGEMKKATFVEEKEGESTSPLVVFFSAPASSLLKSFGATVGFRTRPSPRSISPALMEAIFSAPLENSRHVHILAEPPFPLGSHMKIPYKQVQQENKQVLGVQMNESLTEVLSFALRVDIKDPAGQTSLAAGSSVRIESVSTHGASLYIGDYTVKIYFPLPVDVANTKLRIARKSMYIEVNAPLASSMHVQSEGSIAKRFYTVLDGGIPTSGSIHRVNLDRCPPLKLQAPRGALKWLDPHVTFMFSDRERAVRETRRPIVKDTFVNLKESLHGLLISAAGTQGPAGSVFALRNASTPELLAILLVADLRLDLSSHTVLADAWIAPGTRAIQDKLTNLDVPGVVAIKIDTDEAEAWRYLLPLLIERCRTWSHRSSCEYLTHGNFPLSPNVGTDPERSPFCSCGVGIGTRALPERFKSLASYVTRIAVSPLFAIPYLEKVGVKFNSDMKTSDQGQCKACGKQGGSLSHCGKCKRVRYCSKECQVKDWKVHKKFCVR